jgi:hypothetical protein
LKLDFARFPWRQRFARGRNLAYLFEAREGEVEVAGAGVNRERSDRLAIEGCQRPFEVDVAFEGSI